jgi:hypothetical protein
MGTWECKNITGSPPPCNSLGIFCWGRSLKIQREIKREVFTENPNHLSSISKENQHSEPTKQKELYENIFGLICLLSKRRIV